ncbi:MmpS family transport accessory protein [Nocardia brasiliensis]|uniref:MmpS family transport accessory protein n=1 Tax=Nocardia brasiliensis TaxID=37326 RepID=UPI00245516CB|nr:MmpS family transport accessory protein [Nocardia brasiliensis]
MTTPPHVPQHPPADRPPRLPTWLWVLLIVVTLVVGGGVATAAVVATKDASGSATAVQATPQPARPTTVPPTGTRTGLPTDPKRVRYEVISSTGTVPRLHYIDDAGPHSETKVASPWSKEVLTLQKDVLLTLTAQGGKDADLICRITVDGTVRTERAAQAPQANAICTLD